LLAVAPGEGILMLVAPGDGAIGALEGMCCCARATFPMERLAVTLVAASRSVSIHQYIQKREVSVVESR
jgi:hypothetical protein